MKPLKFKPKNFQAAPIGGDVFCRGDRPSPKLNDMRVLISLLEKWLILLFLIIRYEKPTYAYNGVLNEGNHSLHLANHPSSVKI